jgi:hypothetical protein
MLSRSDAFTPLALAQKKGPGKPEPLLSTQPAQKAAVLFGIAV